MKREYYKQHSDILNEDMSMIVYGEGGYPVIAFQCQDAKSNNFEDFGMIDVLAPFIDDGRIQLFSVDNLDEQSWSDEGGDKAARAWRQEQYFQFVTDELLPRVHSWNNSDRRPIAVGCSMGATHSAIAAFRRPDLFQGCVALSGVYSTNFFFGDYMDENLYNNDVPAFLTNMPADHPYIDLYNQRELVMCVGQGAWEVGLEDLRYIDGQLNRLGVNHWCDFWGYDVNHDWPWWRKQMPYFLNEVLNDIDAKAAEEAAAPVAEEAPKPAAKKAPAKRTTTRKAAATKTAAKKPATRRTAAAKKAEEAKATEEKPATEATPAAEEAAPAKKPAAKRTTTRKAATTKASTAAKEAAAETEAKPVEAEAKPAAKRTTTRKATTTAKKTTTTRRTAAAKKAEEPKAAETAPAAEETAAPAKKAPAKRATTRRTTKKADDAK